MIEKLDVKHTHAYVPTLADSDPERHALRFNSGDLCTVRVSLVCVLFYSYSAYVLFLS